MKKHRSLIIAILVVMAFVAVKENKIKYENAEDLDISLGIGYSLLKNSQGDVEYHIPINSIIYGETATEDSKGSKNTSELHEGNASTLGKSRDDRQRRADKKLFLGTQRVYMIDEEVAKFGVEPMMDILFRNPILNDNGVVLVCKNKSDDYLGYKIEGYDSPVEFIESLVKNSVNYNFFSKDYSLKNVYLTMDAEGRTVVQPYIEIKEQGFELTGLAIFNKDKLAQVVDINEGRLLNLLRENNVRGMVTIQNSEKEYVNFTAKSKRKVKCYKEENKFKFIIELNLNGEIVSNKLYKNLSENPKEIKEFEKDMAEKIQKQCKEFIRKMQRVYKLDCLELGKIAVTKQGRGTGVDWNEIISNSNIEVKVKVRVDKVGRGEY